MSSVITYLLPNITCCLASTDGSDSCNLPTMQNNPIHDTVKPPEVTVPQRSPLSRSTSLSTSTHLENIHGDRISVPLNDYSVSRSQPAVLVAASNTTLTTSSRIQPEWEHPCTPPRSCSAGGKPFKLHRKKPLCDRTQVSFRFKSFGLQFWLGHFPQGEFCSLSP